MARKKSTGVAQQFEQLKKSTKKTYKTVAKKAKATKKAAYKKLGIKTKKKAVDNSDKLKVYANVGSKRKSKKDTKARKKAEYLATLPKHPVKRFFYRLHPKRFFKYWFSKRGAIMALKLSGAGVALAAVIIIGLFAWFRRDLPDPNEIAFTETTKFFDRTGEHLLFELYGEQNRTLLEFDQISDYAKWATIAIEDKDFYNHGGFSVSGIARAAWSNVISGDATGQGGSTITQQFIKNSLLTNEQTVTRKVKELILAIELERLYTKDEILTFYLNEIPYGTQAYGIEAAAQSFFDTTAKELTIDESAMLAALPQAPSQYSPYIGDTETLIDRRDTIIFLMRDQGYITNEEADEAIEVDTLAKIVPLEDRNLYRGVIAPHFIDEVKRRLEEDLGQSIVATGGLNVITTLDYDLQKIANDAVKENFKTVKAPAAGGGSGDNTALSATDVETGQVLAQVGSRDYNYKGYGAYNAAAPPPSNSQIQGRQPGSSFKPFGYAQMFENPRWSPGSMIWDNRVNFPNSYRPNNFDGRFPGKMSVRDALGRSRNIPAVKALYIAGVDDTIALAQNMGNKALQDCPGCLSMVLGAGEVKLDEHTNAYATFARLGEYKPNTYIIRAENASGEVLKEYQDGPGEQVLNEEQAYLVTHMLKDDNARVGTFGAGNPRLVVPGLNHTVKTGTTDESVDGWMMGYTTCLAAGVWAGNHDSKPMNSITSWQTGPIWTQFMREAHEQRPCDNTEFERPDGIKTVRIDTNTGRNATDSSKNTRTDVAASWFEGVDSETEKKVIIDSVSGLIATECTPERAKEEATNTGVAPELDSKDPLFSNWAKANGATTADSDGKEDDVHDCDDDLPTVSLNVNQLTDGVFEFEADINEGTHDMETLNFKIDGTIVSSQNVTSSGNVSYTHVFDTTGTFDITAEVVDSVLYEDSHTQTINVAAVQPIPSIISPVDGGGGTSPQTTVTWVEVPGADDYDICFREVGDVWDCTENDSGMNESETITTFGAGKSWQVYIIANINGVRINRSPSVNFST